MNRLMGSMKLRWATLPNDNVATLYIPRGKDHAPQGGLVGERPMASDVAPKTEHDQQRDPPGSERPENKREPLYDTFGRPYDRKDGR